MVEQIGDAGVDLVADAAYDGDRGALRVGDGPVEVATASGPLWPRDVSGGTGGSQLLGTQAALANMGTIE
ncbi:hypothetical protein [Streptomyces sp. NBC_00154]|uniref:hypothetical protein n=1 Tax=Streptomyces sp. NBC_00154 TaxID=2975670 RepID=UPI00225AA271|nr:hypothetical protein [Streptomyces sp. NBC_00154]